jgi:predicted MFS family arabinose efflux permease
MPPVVSERRIIFLVGAVQFVNILDFMMVMPLGPDFAAALGIPVSYLGLIGGSYTGAAAFSGMLGAIFLDRFDRRTALFVAMLGLVVGTASGALAQGLVSLVLARVLAGFFGGPATALALSIISDVVPPARRGSALGAVMGAFAVSSVLGVPVGLELARRFSWRAPFLSVAALGFVVALSAVAMMPSMRGHLLNRPAKKPSVFSSVQGPAAWLTLLAMVFVFGGNFMLIPNLSAYLQNNLGYPRDHLGQLYLVGGLCSFFVTRGVGRLVDRFGTTAVAAVGAGLYAAVIFVLCIHPIAALPILGIFVAFMLTGSFRMIPISTLSSRVPSPASRAGYMSLTSVVQHLASASGALISSQLLASDAATGQLLGMPRLGLIVIAIAAIFPVLLWQAEVKLRARDAQAAQAAALAGGDSVSSS